MKFFNFRLNYKKWILWSSRLFAVVLILFSISLYYSQEARNLEVNFFDVGQGDAIFIKTPGHQKILIDGGPNNKIIYKLGRSLPFYEKEIDLVILTHPHADHLTGLIEVLKRYKVKKILSTGVVHTTPEYIEWLEEIKRQDLTMEIAKGGQVIDFGGNLQMEILYPFLDLAGKKVENLNNSSIIFKLIYGSNSFLFTGDAEEEVEQELVKNEVNLKADVLKVAHHGSKDATSQEFLNKVQPKFAVISVGAKNKFGHPSQGVINRLERIKAQIFRTDKDGDIKVFSDGEKITINR